MHPLSIMRHPQIFFIEKRPYSNERPQFLQTKDLAERCYDDYLASRSCKKGLRENQSVSQLCNSTSGLF